LKALRVWNDQKVGFQFSAAYEAIVSPARRRSKLQAEVFTVFWRPRIPPTKST
jgi:hypothetical protein